MFWLVCRWFVCTSWAHSADSVAPVIFPKTSSSAHCRRHGSTVWLCPMLRPAQRTVSVTSSFRPPLICPWRHWVHFSHPACRTCGSWRAATYPRFWHWTPDFWHCPWYFWTSSVARKGRRRPVCIKCNAIVYAVCRSSTMCVYVTVRSVIGGRTIVFSNIRITIFHNSLSRRFSTVFSQVCAYSDNEPSNRSISGRNTSSASTATAFRCAAWLPLKLALPLMFSSRSPNSRTLCTILGSKLSRPRPNHTQSFTNLIERTSKNAKAISIDAFTYQQTV